jgi:hypothetical protein
MKRKQLKRYDISSMNSKLRQKKMKRARDSFVPLAGRNLIKKKMKRSYLQKFIHSSRQRDLPHTLKMTLIDS